MASALLVAGILVRVVSFFISDNSGGDAGARVALAARWLQHPDFRLAFGAYSPGHFWLIGLFNLVVNNVTLAGRLLSLVLGIGTILLVWRLARVLYGDTASLLTLAVFNLYTLHVGYSTTSSAEVPFLFFLIGSLYFFFSFFGSEQLWRLGASGLMLSAAESIRYEAWAIFLAMTVALLVLTLRNKNRTRWSRNIQSLLLFCATGGLWPIFVMAGSWRAYGDPMRSLSAHNELISGWFAAHPVPVAHQLAVIPVTFFVSLSPFAFAGAIVGLARSFKQHLTASFAAITLFFWAVQNYEIVSGKLLAMARYSLTLGTLLAVVSGFGLEHICQKVFPRRIRLAEVIVMVLIFVNFVAVLLMSESRTGLGDKFAAMSPRLRYPKRVEDVGAYLKLHMRPDDKVVIDDYNVESNVIADAAGIPLLSQSDSYLASVKQNVGIRDYIETEHPRFVVYSDEGTLRKSLRLPSECADTTMPDEVVFSCKFSNRIYRIYELSYP